MIEIEVDCKDTDRGEGTDSNGDSGLKFQKSTDLNMLCFFVEDVFNKLLKHSNH